MIHVVTDRIPTAQRVAMHSIHDHLFRAVLGNPANAAAELRAVLPEDLADQIDFTSLKAVDTGFISDWLKELRCDLLFEARLHTGEELNLLLLFEHKRKQDPMTSVQVMNYIGEIWLRHHRDHGGPESPPVVAVLLYHGEEPWKEAFGPHERVRLTGLDAQGRARVSAGTPTFLMHVENLPALPVEAVLRRPMPPGTRLVLFCAGWIHNPRDSETAKRLCVEAFVALRLAPDGASELRSICVYLLGVRETKPDLVDKFTHEYMDEETMKIFSSIEEKLRAEGRAEGLAEGMAQGKAEQLLSLLTSRFGDIPTAFRECVASATAGELDAWAIRVLSADTLESVFR